MGSLEEFSKQILQLQSSLEVADKTVPDVDTLRVPEDGISLLGVKSEIYLSYLGFLGTLLIARLRSYKGKDDVSHEQLDDYQDVEIDAIKKLGELRVYLERGVRPLERRMKYSIEKLLTTFANSERVPPPTHGKLSKSARRRGSSGKGERRGELSEEDGQSDVENSASGSQSVASIDELSYRPNLAAFSEPSRGKEDMDEARDGPQKTKVGVYRPPKNTPTALPTTDQDRTLKQRRIKPIRSTAVDDYIATELSNAPAAEPSIGSTIAAGGRRTKSAKEREVEEEKRAYEEANFVRLPKEGKKEKARKRAQEHANSFGGEDLRGLGEGAERISLATAKGGSNSRKRATEDGPRGDGFSAGTFAGKRRKMGKRK